jgi:hypothetical protein
MLFLPKYKKVELPEDLRAKIEILKQAKSKEDCLRQAYDFLVEKYHGDRICTFSKIHELFIRDIGKLWTKSGFLHCTNINYILRMMLIESGFFKESNIKEKWTQIWLFSPHQHLDINLDNKIIHVDVWANRYGIKFGDHAHGFH